MLGKIQWLKYLLFFIQGARILKAGINFELELGLPRVRTKEGPGLLRAGINFGLGSDIKLEPGFMLDMRFITFFY